MEGNIAATYSLIYRFLKQQSQNRAAEAVKKAAKPFVVLRDDIEHKGPPLEDIIKNWKATSHPKSEDMDSSPEDSESSDGDDSSSDPEDKSSTDSDAQESGDTSSSESEADDTSDGDDSSGDEGSIIKKPPQKLESDTSATLSSVAGNSQEVANKVPQIPEKTEDKASESDSKDSDNSCETSASDSSDAESSSNNSDSSDEDEENAIQQPAPTTKPKSESSSESNSESDESSSEQEEKMEACTAKKRNASETEVAVAESTPESSSESEDEPELKSQVQRRADTHVAKRRKVSEDVVVTASQRKARPPPKVRERFQRVKIQNVAPDLRLDNSYEARGGRVNDYGERAHRDLIMTRGAGFRKEKNKKKRGSYRGGEITMESHSIKFDF